MREIKFRAWDQHNKVMHEEGETGLYISSEGDVEVFVELDYGQYMESKNWLLMQYTGLKDKNGVEIYEGDIIKCTDGADEIDIRDSDTGIGCVEWNYTYGFWSISKIENGLGDILQKGYIEIIGNKYENPELLHEV